MKTRHRIPAVALCACVLAGASSARAQEPITQSFDYAFAGALYYGGIGAAIGSGFGALVVTNDVIYAAPSPASARSARVQIAPFATRDRRGVALSLKF